MSLKSAISALSTKAKVIIGTAAVAVVGAAVAAAILFSGGTDTYRVLKVFELDGSAVISREGTGELSAYVGMNLESGDTLTVGDDSTMRISMDNDKYVLLDGGTVLELVAEGTPADSRTSIKLKKGTILNELTSSLSANSSYEVSTPKSTMAVRGTSFLVSVVENEDGSYTITVKTFHGKVEVTLLDEYGNPTDKTVIVGEDNCIIIRTIVNEKTGNPAELDGISFFAFEAGSNIYVEVPEGVNPVFDIDYSTIIELFKNRLLKSNDSGLLVLSRLVEGKLRGGSEEDNANEETASSATTTALQTTAAATEEQTTTTITQAPVTTAAPVTVPPVTDDTITTATTTNAVIVNTATPETTTTVTTKEADTTTTKKTKATTTEETKPEVTTEQTEITTTTTPPVTTTRIHVAPLPPVVTTTTTTTTTSTAPEEPEPEKFTVSFVNEDGVEVFTRIADCNTAVTDIPAVPAKTGYTGIWKYNGDEFTTTTKVTDNITVEAVYTINNYTVTFVNEDGGTVDTRNADYNTTVTDIPAVPTKTGYTGAWKYNGSEFTTTTKVTDNITVEAVYTINNYTVTFIASGFEKGKAYADYGTTVAEADIPAVPPKTGYTGKWVYSGGDFTSDTVIYANTTVEAKYTINSYTVTFTAEGSEDVTRNADYNTTVTDIPAVPARIGYTNGKWMYNGSEFTASTKVTGNITVTAEYTALYTVTYVLEADESVVILTQNDVPDGTVPEEVTLPVVLDTDSDGTCDYYLLEWTQPGDEITGNTTIPVKYELYNSVYQLKITDAGGTIRTGLVLSDTKITLPTAEEVTPLDNYTFVGWGFVNSGGYSDANIKTGAETNSDSVDDYMLNVTKDYDPGAEITLTGSNRLNGGYITGLDNYKFFAVYKGNPMTVTFVNEDGEVVDTRNADYNTAVASLPDVPDKTGYTGVWKYNGSEFTTTTEVTGNITVEAVYTINSYTVTFTAEGSEDVTRNADYNTTVTDIPAVPARIGYTNGKWMYNGSEFTTTTKVTGNITVTAEYTALYTVTYVLEADESVVILTQNDVPDGTVPEEVTLPVVLDTDSDGTYDYYLLEWTQPGDEITGNTTIPVKYELYNSVYQLKITDAGGTIRTGLVLSDTKITLPTAEEVTPLDNYTFVGWGFVNSGGYSDSNIKTGAENNSDSVDDYMLNITPAYNPGAEITLNSSNRLNGGYITGLDNYKFFAVYEGNPMTVTFVNEDGTTVDTRTAVYGKSVESLPDVPDKTGYTGVWKYNGSEFTTTTKVTDNITVEPVYTAKTYTVTYVLENDGTTQLAKQENVEYGTAPDKPNLPTVLDTDSDEVYDYYLFGWEHPTDLIEEDTTINVTYEQYSAVSEVKITDAGGTKQHFLSMKGKEITLPETAADMENFTFVGWGAVSSGGYADSSVKVGCTDDTDYSSDVFINNDYITKYSPGAVITLTDGMRMGQGFSDYSPSSNNYKFAAMYVGRDCTVTFLNPDGTTASEQVIRCGDEVLLPDFTSEELEGFRLAWTYNDAELSDYYLTVTGDMEIVAKYISTT